MKIAIAAAGGNVGTAIANNLAKSYHIEMVLLAHQASSLEKLVINNAQKYITDISDVEQVVNATQGVDALFWMVPPVFDTPSIKEWYRLVTKAGVEAVKRNKISKVVLLSSLGAGTKENLGTITYAGEMEVAFDQLDADVLALRPGYFMENFLMQMSDLTEKNEFTFSYAPDHDIPFISADDIGETAARYLKDETWSGHWKTNLMGPENITLTDAAARISKVLGREIKYRQSTLNDIRIQLADWGMLKLVEDEMIDLFVALGDPNGAYATPRTFEAFTPTTIEEFCGKKLLPSYIEKSSN